MFNTIESKYGLHGAGIGGKRQRISSKDSKFFLDVNIDTTKTDFKRKNSSPVRNTKRVANSASKRSISPVKASESMTGNILQKGSDVLIKSRLPTNNSQAIIHFDSECSSEVKRKGIAYFGSFNGVYKDLDANSKRRTNAVDYFAPRKEIT